MKPQTARATSNGKLKSEDYASLARSYITRPIADAAGIYRVPSIEGRELVGRRGPGDYSGIIFPYRRPGDPHSVLNRLRLDNPSIDATTGKESQRYLVAPNERNRLYFPPCAPDSLSDATVPIIFAEGEKKCLALWRMALESNGAGKPAFLPVSAPGVWSWRGTVGTSVNARGERVPEKGPLPDFDRIIWQDRKVTILFDANTATNTSVAAARRELARELTRRGAGVFICDLPDAAGVNGPDDFLGLFGPAKLATVLQQARRHEWRDELIRSETTGNPLGILANCITALQSAPEWHAVLAFDEFAQRVTTRSNPPWGPVETWTEQEDRLCADWMQHKGLRISINDASAAIETVARDCHYHPVREYLDSLKWDGTGRIDDWLCLYLGAESTDLIRAFGAKWLLSAVARIFKPGVKADCCLILEGRQGTFKSTALRVLGGKWFTDDIPDLGAKDAGFATLGAWIVEMPELDAISRAEMSRVKSFLSRSVDHYRPPYGRRYVDFPRQCVFAGTVNHHAYLRDETGGRRFWPLECGKIQIDALKRDRDQIWAEAVVRFHRGENWWLETTDLNTAAAEQQDDRYMIDPWETLAEKWLVDRFGNPYRKDATVTIDAVLKNAIDKQPGMWTHHDHIRVGSILRRLGWHEGGRPRSGEDGDGRRPGEDGEAKRPRIYSPK